MRASVRTGLLLTYSLCGCLLAAGLTAHALASATSDSLLGYWKLDETTAGTFADASGGANTGTGAGALGSQNTPQPSTDVSSAISFPNARSLLFDGTDDSVNFGSGSVLNIGTSNFTVSAWVKGNSMAAADVIFGKSNGGSASSSYGFLFGLFGGLNPGAVWANGNVALSVVQSNVAISNGAWTHVAVVVDRANSANCKVYINGSAVSTTVTALATNTGNVTNAVNLVMGSESDGGAYWDGRIDDARFYKRALTAEQVADLAAGTHPRTYWTGASDTSVENAGNWSGSYIPDLYSRIVVQDRINQPVLTGSLSLAGLQINTGAILSLNGQNLTMKDSGTVTNYSTLAMKNTETLTSVSLPTDKGTVMLTGTGSTTGFIAGNAFYNLTLNDGLIGYWKLDETSGTVAADASGYTNSGALVNGPTISTDVPPVHFYDPRSLLFDGINDRVFMQDPISLQPPRAVSTGAWFKTTSSSFQEIIRKRWYGYALYMLGGQILTNVWEANGSELGISSPLTYNDGQWHHVMITYNGTTFSLYVDGVLVSKQQGTGTNAIYYEPGGVAIGQDGDNPDGFFSGNIDDVRLYNRALSPAEVSALGSGNEPSATRGTVTMNADVTVNGTVTLNGGTLDASSSNRGLIVSGSWLNNGGIFVPHSSTVTFAGTAAGLEILSGGAPFAKMTLSGAGGRWNIRDRLTASGTVVLSNGTLNDSGSYVMDAGQFVQAGGTIVPQSGTIVLTNGSSLTSTFTSALHTLRIEDPTETSLVGYWKFDEGTNSGRILDSSGQRNTGIRTGTGTIWSDSSLPALSYDNPFAMQFNGIQDEVDVPQSSVFELQRLTVSAWIDLSTSAGDRNAIVTYGKGSELNGGSVAAESYALIYHQTANLLRFRLNQADSTSFVDLQVTPVSPIAGRWVHVVATWDGSTASLFENGILIGTQSTAGTINYTSDSLTKLRIGNWFGNNERYFMGKIDDVRLYNRALSATEVRNLSRGEYAHGGSGTSTLTLGSGLSTDYLALDSGNMNTSSKTLSVTNTFTQLGGRGALTLGSAATTLGGLSMSGSSVTSGVGTMDVNGDVSVLTGSFIAPSTSMTVSGNWTKTGGSFSPRGGTVTLDGTDQVMRGSTTFYNLTKTATVTSNLAFAAGQTQTISGALVLQGATDNPLRLSSTLPGTQWNIYAAGSRTVNNLYVTDSNNTSATINCLSGCTDNGHNNNWQFVALETTSNSGGSGTSGGGGGGGGGGAGGQRSTTSSTSSSTANQGSSASSGPFFDDVSAGSWYAQAVNELATRGVVSGYLDAKGNRTRHFGPAKPVNYAEFAKMLLSVAQLRADTHSTPVVATWPDGYMRVADARKLTPYMHAVKPGTPISRGDVAQSIADLFQLSASSSSKMFADLKLTQPSAKAVLALAALDLLKGSSDAQGHTVIRPGDTLNRAEAAVLLVRLLHMQLPSAGSSSSAPAGPPAPKAAVVATEQLNVRADARADSYRRAMLKQGDSVQVVYSLENGWSYVQTKNGKEGYVMTKFLR